MTSIALTIAALERAEESAIRVECLIDAAAFASMRDEWTELLQASASNGPFVTWEWLHAWWTHLRGANALRLIAIRDEGRLIAIAPLLAHGSIGWFSRLEFLGTGDAGSDYLDLIARRGREADAIAAIARYLETKKLTLRLRNLRPGALAAQLPAHLAPPRWRCTETPSGECPVIPLTGQSWDSYLATLGSAHRANFRRRLRALNSQFQLHFARVTSEEERDECLRALFAFHDQRWGARGGSSAFATPALRAFHHDVTRRAMASGWLRMFALRLNGTLVASMYGFLYDHRFYFYQHGFDDQWRPFSVGLVQMGLTIQAAIDEGAREFDMLWGTEGYKSLWARETRQLRAVNLFPSHIGGAVHRRTADARIGMKKLVHLFSHGGRRAT